MCIIIYKPRALSVERHILETCFANNPDGAGYMFPCEGKLLIKKGFFAFEDFYAAWEKTRKVHGDAMPVVFHFRIATAGGIDKLNCHPHRIAPDLGFVHNGILSCISVHPKSRLSDTILYRDRYLGKLTGASLNTPVRFQSIDRHIGAGNKFVFMNGEGETVICNERQGVWKDGLWFSNYSFLFRRLTAFPAYDDEWRCDYCGSFLETVDELTEGVCRECQDYFTTGLGECAGCYSALHSMTHRTLGWCDECGYEIYGRNWSEMLKDAAGLSSWGSITGCL